MRFVIQRVKRARIVADGVDCGEIGRGLFVMVGLRQKDSLEDLHYLVNKTKNLRVFDDSEGRMNLSVVDVGGSLAVVSQFTLYGDVRRGNRPSWSLAMPVEEARAFWPKVEESFLATGVPCIFGVFQARMECEILNEGPVTLILDSEERLRPRRDHGDREKEEVP